MRTDTTSENSSPRPLNESLHTQRGWTDALVVCCDGLKGLPEAIKSVWPSAVTQLCIVHLIRSALKYVNSTDRKKVAAALKPVYTPWAST